MNIKMKIRKDDEVQVIAGKDLGKKGKVLRVLSAENRVVVSGINVVKKHTKPSQTSEGGIINKELPIHVSNISLIDPKTSGPSRVGIKMLADGKKVRFAKKSGEIIENKGK